LTVCEKFPDELPVTSTRKDPAEDPYAAKANVAPYAAVVYPAVFETTKLN